jgi:hypothetical protein
MKTATAVAIALFIMLVAGLGVLKLYDNGQRKLFAPFEGNFCMFIVKTDRVAHGAIVAAALQNPVSQIVTTDRKIYTEGEAVGYPSY